MSPRQGTRLLRADVERVKAQVSSSLWAVLTSEDIPNPLAVVVNGCDDFAVEQLASHLRADGASINRVLMLANAVAAAMPPDLLVRTLSSYPQLRAELDLPGELE